MTTSEQVRRIPIPAATVAVFALVAALLAPAYAGDQATVSDRHATHTVVHQAMTARQVAFHDQMRKLWEDHITWTRLAIVSFADGSAGFDATAARLLRNQSDIGDAIKPFYGRAAGNALTGLLEEHITIAVTLLQAAKAGDSAAAADASADWYANADDIADFVAAAHPRSWPRGAMREAMRMHLDQTLAEAQHELTGHYRASVKDYREIHAHILAMADTLSSGIMQAFPRRFR